MKRHKPSVIYLPAIDTWYHTLSEATITTFLGLLRAIPPTDPVLVLGITDTPPDKVSQDMLRDLFGFSRHNRFTIKRPSKVILPHCLVNVGLTPLETPRGVFLYYSHVCEEISQRFSRALEPQKEETRSSGNRPSPASESTH